MKEAFGGIWFRLGRAGDQQGIFCGEQGAFAGVVPLLSEVEGTLGRFRWAPRPVSALNGGLSAVYGLPVDMTAKMRGLAAVAGALTAGNVALARIATLHLQLPDPPPLEKGTRSHEEIVALAAFLHRSGILKIESRDGAWKRDVSNEPRPTWRRSMDDGRSKRGGDFARHPGARTRHQARAL